MITTVDSNVLIKWSAQRRTHPDDLARIAQLLEDVSKDGGKILIPTPCLAEFLVGAAEATTEWLNGLERKRGVVVAPFDRRSAFECALLDRAAIGSGDKKGGRTDAWQRIKIDRQVIAIARANNSGRIVTDDEGLRSTALSVGMSVLRIRELALPESARQGKLFDPTGATQTTSVHAIASEPLVVEGEEVLEREERPNAPPPAGSW